MTDVKVKLDNSGCGLAVDGQSTVRVLNETGLKKRLNAGETMTHYLQVDCGGVFLQPPKYVVSYEHEEEQVQLPLTLPIILTKFAAPDGTHSATIAAFMTWWAAPLENEVQFTSKAKKTPQKAQEVLQGCGFGTVQSARTMCGAAALSLAGTGGVGIPLAAKLDFNEAGQARLSVRSGTKEVSQTVAHILATYILEPPQKT